MKVFMLIKNLKVNDKFSSHKIFSSNIISPLKFCSLNKILTQQLVSSCCVSGFRRLTDYVIGFRIKCELYCLFKVK